MEYCKNLILLSTPIICLSVINLALTEMQKATLMAIFQEVGFSLNAHVPLTSIQRHFRKDLRGFCRKALKELVRMGYVTKHPTGGSMTYSLTTLGVSKIKELLEC